MTALHSQRIRVWHLVVLLILKLYEVFFFTLIFFCGKTDRDENSILDLWDCNAVEPWSVFFSFTEKARMVCIPLVTLTLSGHAPFSALLCIDCSSRERKGNNANLFVMTLRAT